MGLTAQFSEKFNFLKRLIWFEILSSWTLPSVTTHTYRGLVTPKGSVIIFLFLLAHILEIVRPLESLEINTLLIKDDLRYHLLGQISKSSERLGHRIAFYEGRG